MPQFVLSVHGFSAFSAVCTCNSVAKVRDLFLIQENFHAFEKVGGFLRDLRLNGTFLTISGIL